MVLQIKICNDHDRQKWDDYVSAHKHGHFMQSWAWGLFQEKQGWIPLRLLALRDDVPCGAVQILARHVLRQGWVLYAPRGPVLNMTEKDVVYALLQAVREHYPFAAVLRLDPYIREEEIETESFSSMVHLPEEWSYWNAPKYVFWLDLSRGTDAMFSAMTAGQRSEIRYPTKKGVLFVRGDKRDAADFHRLMVVMSLQKGIACHGLPFFQRLLEIFIGNGMGDLIFAVSQGTRIACGLSLHYGKKSWLMYAAMDREWHHLRSSRALHWEMIRFAVDAGCERYDFRGTATGRIPGPQDPGFGVYKFKKDFGPEFVPLVGYYDYVVHPWLYKSFRFAETQGLPIVYNAYRWFKERIH